MIIMKCNKQLVMADCQVLAGRDRDSKKIRDETETYIDADKTSDITI